MIYDINEIDFEKNLDYLTGLLSVQELLNIQIRRLSLGERMKMELINNFIYSPELIFLDEPTIGLDLESQIAVQKFIKTYAEQNNATVKKLLIVELKRLLIVILLLKKQFIIL